MHKIAKVAVFFYIIFIAWPVFCQEDMPSSIEELNLHKKAIEYAREGDFKQALELIKKLVEERPDSPGLVFDYITVLSWAGKCQEAVKAYEQLARDYDIPDYALPEIARSYRIVGRYDRAIVFYKRYNNIKGKEEDAIKGLFYTYLDAGQLNNARDFVKEQAEKDRIKEEELKIYLADILMREGKTGEAATVYEEVLKKDPANTHAQLGISKALIMKDEYEEADAGINQVLDREPRNIEALFCKGEILEVQGDYMAAYQIYEKILSIYPNSQAAVNLKYRALISMGSDSLVEEKLKESKDEVDPAILDRLKGNKAMHRIRWWESDDALQILDKDKIRTSLNGAEEPVSLRTHYDRILAFSQKSDMDAVIREYEVIAETGRQGEEAPPWVLTAVGDAYLEFQQPEKALTFYKAALAKDWDPEYGQTTLSMYQALVESGRYEEAGALLEKLDSRVPVQIVDRGVLKDNVRKGEIAYNRYWLYIYQDRLAEAQGLILKGLSKAPSDTNIRTALAHTYLLRDWPRLALEEFEIVRRQDPDDLAGQVGYCYALNENGRGEEARRIAKELLKKSPNQRHIRQLNRYLEVEDMRALIVTADSTREDPGAEEWRWSTRFEQVVAPARKIFADFIWRCTSEDDLKSKTKRAYAGIDWRLNREWWFLGAVSEDVDEDNLGGLTQITLRPDDYFSFIAAYDSHSLNVPIRARTSDIEGEEYNFTAVYRHSEGFLAQVIATYLDMSDTNEHKTYNIRLDKAITTSARWKTRLALEGTRTTNSLDDALYYNPERVYTAYLIPMVEHTWFERYETYFIDRLYLNYGLQKQKDFSSEEVWSIRYEQDHKLSDVLSFSIGVNYSRENYDGSSSDVNNYDFALKYSF